MVKPINQDIKFEIEQRHTEDSEKDISAIVVIDDYVLIGSDEGNHVQVLKKQADGQTYKQESIVVLDEDAEEIDIEGMAQLGNTIYVACSCALVRKSIKSNKTVEENLKRLQKISKESERLQRCQLFKFSFDPSTGKSSKVDVVCIKDKLTHEKSVLARFMNIPSKENGVDIEGIAVDDKESLYLGFRGPVLRGNYVPILITAFNDDADDYEIRYIQMEGRGVRDMTKVQDGFLIIGGPVGDQECCSYNLYFWDGSDTIPGEDRKTVSRMDYLGEIPTEDGAKAEGIALIEETSTEYQVVIVYDSLKNGKPGLFRVEKKVAEQQ